MRGTADVGNTHLTLDHDDFSWTYDTVDEFLADVRKHRGHVHFSVYGSGFAVVRRFIATGEEFAMITKHVIAHVMNSAVTYQRRHQQCQI